MNKRLLISESCGDSNWCTPCRRKPDQHATHFPRSVHIYPSTICISCGPRIATFSEWPTDLDGSHCSWEKGLQHNPHHADWPICGSVPSFPSKPTNEAVGLSQASVNDKLLGLLGPYHQHAIGTFNTCSRGPTHWSLINIGGGYNLRGASFSHTTPRPSQLTVSTFHLRAPPGLRLIHPPLPKDLKREQTLNLASGSLHSTTTATYHLSISLLMLSDKEIGLTKINRKVNLNATTVPYNSYILNAQS
jgi:hypothetical protein